MKPHKGLRFEIEWSGPDDMERGIVERVDKEYVHVRFPGLCGYSMRIKRKGWQKMIDREELFID